MACFGPPGKQPSKVPTLKYAPDVLAGQDSLFHRLWQCGALSHLRRVKWSQVCLWPPCTYMHGLVPKDFRGCRELLLALRVQAFTLYLAADVYDGCPSEPIPLECPTLFAFRDRSVVAKASLSTSGKTVLAQPSVNGGTTLLKCHENSC